MDRDFSDFVSKVLDNTDIVSLISRYVKVERKGNTHWACCPFHHETQPSFSISADKQLFHCFGCKESGNAISFLMKYENIEFMDALKMLAERAGLEVPERTGYGGPRVDKKQKQALLDLMRDAARHYHQNLSDPRAKVFNDYIKERGLTPGIVKRFGLGASLDFTEMIDYLLKKGYTFEQLRAVGIGEEKDGRKYDVFGKRLIFPIIDNMSNVVAFGGRTLEKDVHFAKYRNSSKTDIFDKSKVIYGINLLKKRKAVAKIDYVIMTEGYMDVIALHKAGFDTAVASMGTALTSGQARQLKLYSDLVYISYDGDGAGQKATMRGLDILRESGLTVKVVRLPDGLDPDEIIKRDGASGYQKLLDEAVPLTAYKLDTLAGSLDLNDPDRRAQYAIECTKVIMALDNPIEQDQYFSYLAEKSGFAKEALMRQANFELRKNRDSEPSPRPVAPDRSRDGADASTQAANSEPVKYDDSLKFFLSSLLRDESYIDYDRNVAAAMPDDVTLRIYQWARSKHPFKPSDVFIEFGDGDPFINELFDFRNVPGNDRQLFVDIETELYRRVIGKELGQLRERQKTAPDDPEIKKRLSALTLEMVSLKKYRS